MSLLIVDVDRVPPQPWRNGGGQTRELLAWPTGASGDWQLRVSVADIARDGAFSAFAGIERHFAVLAGAGVRLRFAAQARTVDADSAPLVFDGAATPHCELLGGPTRDLNLMLRRDAGHGELRRVDADAEWLSAAPWRGLFSLQPLTLQIDDTDAARLPAWSLVFSDHAARQRWRVQADGEAPRAWWLAFTPRPGAAR